MLTDNTTSTDTIQASIAATPHPDSQNVQHHADTDVRRARPPRRWLRRVALVAAVAFAVSGCVALVDLITNDSATTTSGFDQHIERLRLDVANGDVEIIGTDDPVVTLEITTHGGLRTPHHEESARDGVLSIDADCGVNPFAPTCSIDYTIHLPRGTEVFARGSGTDYALRDVSGDVDIALDGGDTDLTFAATPRIVHARANGGDIDITVANDTPHRVVASSDGGSTDVDIATDPDSPYVIDAHANGGDITITRPTPTSSRAAP